MPISRGQEPRQLYRGGGIMNLAPRQEYGLGSIVKSVKKAVSGAAKGIKSFAKSDVGKMALLLGGGYLAGGGGMPSFLGGRGLGGFQFSNLPGASLFSKSSAIGGPKYNLGGFGATGANKGMSGLTKGLIGGGALTALLGAAQEGDQEAIAATRDIGALKGYLSSYYENLGYKEEEIPAMVDRDTAEYSSSQGGYATGGRVGAMYGGRMKLEDGTLDPRIREIVIDLMDNEGFEFGEAVKEAYRRVQSTENKANGGRIGYSGGTDFENWKKGKGQFEKEQGAEQLYREYLEDKRRQEVAKQKQMAANGGRIGYAFGSNDLVDQASGIMGLPKRTNKAGVKELDLRDSGGFIPPVGVKEKADDVPAMLSNNEFVFTADAVRGMGDGNVNKGAQRMYDMMKKLENGGRV